MITPEVLAHWYFRLNGFLTIGNFIVHPDRGVGIQTEVDVLGVRFPYRSELLEQPMQDDPLFNDGDPRPLIISAEVKTNRGNLNRAWTEPSRANMQRLLHAIGAFPLEHVNEIADTLYRTGRYEGREYRISWLIVGASPDEEFRVQFPAVPHVSWRHICDFIFQRFTEFERQKRTHDQWDAAGKHIWNIFHKTRPDPKAFQFDISHAIGVRCGPAD